MYPETNLIQAITTSKFNRQHTVGARPQHSEIEYSHRHSGVGPSHREHGMKSRPLQIHPKRTSLQTNQSIAVSLFITDDES